MKNNELTKEIKKAVEVLVASDNGCSTFKLDDNLAICVGWSEGFDPKDDNLIHSKNEPSYGLVAGIKVWTSDDLRTDYDWINFPFFENQEVIDTEVTISDKQNYKNLANWLLKEYNDLIASYKIVSKDGLIKSKIEMVEEIESCLNEGIRRTEEEHEKCVCWLMEFMTTNDITLEELEDLCFKDSDWVFNQIFGE